MNTYVLYYIFLCIITILYDFNTHKKVRDILFGVAILSMLFLACFRDINIGADTLNYCKHFEDIRNLSWKEIFIWGWEPGYVALNKIIGMFFSSSRALIILMGILVLCPVFWIIRRDSEFPCMSLVIFVATGAWIQSMYVYRQWCAMAICLLSFQYIKKRKFIPFVVVIFCATLFHRTAAIFLLVYFAYGFFKMKTEILVGLLFFSILLGMLGKPILLFLNNFARIPSNIEYNGGINFLIFLWISIIIIFLFCKTEIRNPGSKRMYYCMLLIAGTLQPIAFTFSLWARVIQYFSVSLVILLPGAFCKIMNTKENKRWKIPTEIILYILFFIFYTYNGLDEYLFMKI